LLEYYRPKNFLGEKFVRHLADQEWEISRLERHKVLLMERRLRARLEYQAYREKATQADKAALAKKLAEQPAGPLILPEEVLDGVIAKIDNLLLPPAQEHDHARALEVAIVYVQQLDRLPLRAAMTRSNISNTMTTSSIHSWRSVQLSNRRHSSPTGTIANGTKVTNTSMKSRMGLRLRRKASHELTRKDQSQPGKRPQGRAAHRAGQINREPQCAPP
jgi:hypothetical protein